MHRSLNHPQWGLTTGSAVFSPNIPHRQDQCRRSIGLDLARSNAVIYEPENSAAELQLVNSFTSLFPASIPKQPSFLATSLAFESSYSFPQPALAMYGADTPLPTTTYPSSVTGQLAPAQSARKGDLAPFPSGVPSTPFSFCRASFPAVGYASTPGPTPDTDSAELSFKGFHYGEQLGRDEASWTPDLGNSLNLEPVHESNYTRSAMFPFESRFVCECLLFKFQACHSM